MIAAVHGYCIGGGVDLITACDIRLAAADAMFSVRETQDRDRRRRRHAATPAGHRRRAATSPSWRYTGKDVTAARATEIGLVNDVLPDTAAVPPPRARWPARSPRNSPLAVQGSKAVLRAGRDRTVAEGLDYVAVWNAAFFPSNDLVEAMAAFVEKRPATVHRRLQPASSARPDAALFHEPHGVARTLADQVVVSLACTVDGNV